MSFLSELNRRNVFRVAVAYVVVGWLMIEVASVLGPALRLPNWTTTFVAFVLILGFPIALVLSWAYELTSDGMKKTESVPLAESITAATGRKLDFVIIGVLALAAGFMFVDNYLPQSRPFAGAEIDPASLEPVPDDPEATAPAVPEQPQPAVLPNSVAVLPLQNLSPDPNNAYFAAGIHEEILNQLAKLSNLNVISRTSVARYADSGMSIPQIAAELNVQTVMEGSVRYANNRVLVTMQLIDPETDAHLWSDSYNRDLADVFAIQADIAMNVANALAAEFTPAEQASIERRPTESLDAYDLYLAAEDLMRAADGNGALEKIDEALAIDPTFARAWALKADLHGGRSQAVSGDRLAAEREAMVRAALRAAELEPGLIEAKAMLAGDRDGRGEWVEAEALFRDAFEGSNALTALWYGVHLMGVGHIERAAEVNAISRRTDPLNQTARGFYLLGLALAGNVRAAEEEYARGTAVFGGPWFGDWYISMVRLGVGGLPSDGIPLFSLPGDQSGPNVHNEMRQYLGSPDAGLARLREIVASIDSPTTGALLATGVWAGHFGDPELAYEAIAEATRRNGQNVLHFWLPSMRDVRQLPRFKIFMRDIGLVDYWNELGWPAFCRPLGGEDFACS